MKRPSTTPTTPLIFFLSSTLPAAMAEQPDQPLPRDYGIPIQTSTGEPAKTAWPEVVGLTADEAGEKIKQDMPEASIAVVPLGYFVTMDFRTDRVRVHVDSDGKVSRAPTIG